MGNLSRFVLWDFPRASWQYDVIVALILAFIFLTPREIFRDQPKAANVVMLPAEQGTGLFWIAPEETHPHHQRILSTRPRTPCANLAHAAHPWIRQR